MIVRREGGASANLAQASIIRGKYILLRALDDNQVETLTDSAIYQARGRIADIGPFADIAARYPGVPVTGEKDSLVIPGLVDAHHHVGLTPVQQGSPDLPLELWLTHRLRHRAVNPYLDTLYSAFEHIASGVTAVQHLSGMLPAPVSAWRDVATPMVSAYRDIGLRVSYALCTRDQHRLVYAPDAEFVDTLPPNLQAETTAYLESTRFSLSEFETNYLEPMIDRFGITSDPLVRLSLAPINLERASDAMLRQASRLAEQHGLGIHLHLSETPYQKEFSRRRFRKSSVAHLADIGFLGPHVTLGHGTWVDEGDLDLMHRHGVCLCHNASSNLRLRSGIAPIKDIVARGIPVALGIDEAGLNDDRDMLQEMRLVKHLHCRPGLFEAPLTPAQVFRMATEHGARAIGFGEEIGTIAVGKRADLVVLDYGAMTRPSLDPATDPVSALVYRAKSEHVLATIIEGRIVYADGQFPFLDRDAVLDELAEQMSQTPSPAEAARAGLSERILPYIQSFYRDWNLPPQKPWYTLNGR